MVTVQPLMLRWKWSAVARYTRRRRVVAVHVGDPAGGDQPGDLGGDGGRRVAALLLPPLGRRTTARGRRRSPPPSGRGRSTARASPWRPAWQAIRIGYAVSSSWSPPVSGATLPLTSELRGNRPSAQLLPLEQEPHRGPRGRQVTAGQQPGERLVEVAGEDLAVGAEVDRACRPEVSPALTACPHGLPSDGDHGAGERLVLAGLQHVRRQPVRRAEPVGLRAATARGTATAAAAAAGRTAARSARTRAAVRVERRPGGRAGDSDRRRARTARSPGPA